MDPIASRARSAVVDLGSNSVRLVVFEVAGSIPVPIFNEKAVLRLGRGLQNTGRLNPEGVAQAIDVMARFHAVARAMHADPFEVLATAAVRDAGNGPAFVAELERVMPGVPIRILSGTAEAGYSAAGLLSGAPHATGTLADIGGGSLELVRLEHGAIVHSHSLRLGVLRLQDRAGGDLVRAKSIVEADLAAIPWIGTGGGRDLFLVGGAFRALARLHMAQEEYPLHIVHHYALPLEEARHFAGLVPTLPKRLVERVPGLRRRADDLPFAAVVLRRLLRAISPARVVFSAQGLREGWFLDRVAPHLPRAASEGLSLADEGPPRAGDDRPSGGGDPTPANDDRSRAGIGLSPATEERLGAGRGTPPPDDAGLPLVGRVRVQAGQNPLAAGGLPPGEEPLLSEARAMGLLLGRDPGLPAVLFGWTAPLFAGETALERLWREAACALADTGSHDHPEYRSEQSFLRILRQPGSALDHPGRAFLATAVAIRYDAEGTEPFIAAIRPLLEERQFARAERLGLALRLAAALSGGLPGLLAGAAIAPGRPPGKLTLTVHRGVGLLAGDGVWRRLERLAQTLNLVPSMEVAVD